MALLITLCAVCFGGFGVVLGYMVGFRAGTMAARSPSDAGGV